MTSDASSKTDPHPGIAALAIAAMSLLVAGVLEAIGPLRALDEIVASWAGGLALGGGLADLSMTWAWVWTVLLVFGVAFSVIHLPQRWQRWIVSLSSLVLTLGWLPVLILIGFTAPLAMPVVALIWASAGSMIYAANHSDPN